MNRAERYNETIKRMANAEEVYNPNTVLLAQLNGDISDLSQNQYTPTITGSPQFVTGYFSGTQSCQIKNNNVFGFYGLAENLTDDFSLDFLVYAEGARDVSLGRYTIVLSRNSQYGGLGILSSSTATADGVYSSVHISYSYNTWYHVALTRETGITRIFTNGVYAGQLTTSYNAGTNLRASSAVTYSGGQDRIMRISNLRLSNIALHEVNNGVYTFPVPTHLYTN